MYIEKTMHDTVINNNINTNDNEGLGGSGDPTESSSVKIKADTTRFFVKESLRDRIYYAAKDGFSLTLLIILKDLDPFVVTKLLNQVRDDVLFYLYHRCDATKKVTNVRREKERKEKKKIQCQSP